MMKRIGLIFAVCIWASVSRAALDPGPIVINFLDGVGVSTPMQGNQGILIPLIGQWADASINKKSRALSAAWRSKLREFDPGTESARLLSCVAVPEPRSACRDARVGDDTALVATPLLHGTIVLLTPEWRPEQLMIRAVFNDVEQRGGKLATVRSYTALFTARAPADLVKSDGKQAGTLESWWLDGSPTRLDSETRHGFEEISAMATMLAADVGPGGEAPAAWQSLPDVKALADAHRVNCQGIGCTRAHRIVRESDDRTWLAFATGPIPGKGPVLASFDAAALEHALNLYIYTQMGVSSY